MTATATIADVLSGVARWCIVEGDSLALLQTLPDASVDHIITDPPYEAESHTKSRRVHRGPPGAKGEFVNVAIPFDAITQADRAVCGAEFGRICRRWCVVFCQIEGVPLWRLSCEKHGLTHRRTCIWVKPDGSPQFTGDRPGTGYECFEAMHAKGASRWNGGGRRGVFVHNCGSQVRNPQEDHPTPKPEALMLELVSLFTDADEVVFDPFAGGGTTGVACLRLGRRFIGIEREPRFAAIARERLAAEDAGSTLAAQRAGQIAMFGVIQ